jgi:hypothetical protein
MSRRPDKPKSQSRPLRESKVIDTIIQRAVDAGQSFDPVPEIFHIALQVAAGLGHVRLVELLLKIDGIDPFIL